MRHRVLVAFIVIVGLVIAAWLNNERMTAVKEKERLWKSLSRGDHSNLAECLESTQGYSNQMEDCMEIDKAVERAVGD